MQNFGDRLRVGAGVGLDRDPAFKHRASSRGTRHFSSPRSNIKVEPPHSKLISPHQLQPHNHSTTCPQLRQKLPRPPPRPPARHQQEQVSHKAQREILSSTYAASPLRPIAPANQLTSQVLMAVMSGAFGLAGFYFGMPTTCSRFLDLN